MSALTVVFSDGTSMEREPGSTVMRKGVDWDMVTRVKDLKPGDEVWNEVDCRTHVVSEVNMSVLSDELLLQDEFLRRLGLTPINDDMWLHDDSGVVVAATRDLLTSSPLMDKPRIGVSAMMHPKNRAVGLGPTGQYGTVLSIAEARKLGKALLLMAEACEKSV